MPKLIRTTLTGAVVFLLPIGILAFFVGKILTIVHKLVEPISEHLPVKSVAGVSATVLVALFGIIAVSFIAGLFAKSRIARGAVEKVETHFLGRLPVYGLLKSLSNDVIAPDETAEHPVVLVRLDDAWQLGILIGPAAEGTHSVVFVMDSPTPQSGAVMIVGQTACTPPTSRSPRPSAHCRREGLRLGELVKLPVSAT